jgi:tetratricopeptide (TPR) repeat protein
MNKFSTQSHFVGRSTMIALFFSSMFGMQTADGHEFSALIKAKKYLEVERAISTKLTVDPNHVDALLAKVDLILIESKVSRLDEGVKIAEQCIASHPKNSECHEALGNVLGIKAQKGGMMSGISSLGKIRDSFKKAIELDPKNYSAAHSLMTFYLEVPGLMGGNNSKAKEVIANTQKVSPAAASLLQAKFDLKDDKFESARTTALAANGNTVPAIAQLQNDVLLEIGQTLVKENKLLDAEKMFREVIQRFPDSSVAYLGLGRSLQELGKPKEALPHLEKSLSLEASAGVFYRLGKTWQAIGEKAKAIAMYEKSLAFSPELGKKTRADAEDQLKVLK